MSVESAYHKWRAFDLLLAQPPITHAELSVALRASLTYLQVDSMFLQLSLVFRRRR